MTRTRIVVLSLLGILLVLATIHVSVHGLPDVSSWNPHAR
jgi:hypothetical protein